MTSLSFQLDEIGEAIRAREYVRARAALWRVVPAAQAAEDSAALEQIRANAEELDKAGCPCGELLAELERIRPDLFGPPERIQLARVAAAIRDNHYTVALDELGQMLPVAREAGDTVTLDAIAVHARSLSRIATRADERNDGERLLEEIERIRPQAARAHAEVCRCGRPFAPGEQFCPDCGAALSRSANADAIRCVCGSPLARTDRFCPTCGKAALTAAPPRVHTTHAAPLQRPPYAAGPHVGGWGFAIFFFGLIGGTIGWLHLKRTDPERADHVLKWGLIWTVGTGALWSLVTFLLVASVAHGG